jgi:hypothetical protein
MLSCSSVVERLRLGELHHQSGSGTLSSRKQELTVRHDASAPGAVLLDYRGREVDMVVIGAKRRRERGTCRRPIINHLAGVAIP